MDASLEMHAYEKLPLFTAGIVLGVWLIGLHAVMLVQGTAVKRFLRRFHRNDRLGQILLGVGMIWFWLIVAQPGDGLANSLAMDLGDQFNALKPLLKILVPVSIVLVALAVKEFLAVRALGLLGLMAAAPLLESAFQKDPTSRLLVPIYAYAMIVASLYFVGMPYLFRDAVSWATAEDKRWKILSLAGLGYGVATLACAVLFWRGY
jgi:hypothetical protein